MRYTKQRSTILEVLRNTDDHPSADIIYERVRKKLPKISLGTVYRNLEFLVSTGEILKINTTSGQAKFDGNTESHIHFRCTECGKIEDFAFKKPAEDFRRKTSDGKIIRGCYIEYYGLCLQCSNKCKESKMTV